MRSHRNKHSEPARSGVVTVEVSLTLSVFVLFLAGIIEFGHLFMVNNTLNGATRIATRLGVSEGVTTQQVRDQLTSVVQRAVGTDPSRYTIYIKDASIFDTAPPGATLDVASLPDIELANADTRQMFLIRVEVFYDDVAIMPPFWAKNIRLHGQSVARHE